MSSGESGREWLEICDSFTQAPKGWIPRDVAVSIGVDCSPLEWAGTVWITSEQSERIHTHPEWHEGDWDA